MRDLLLDQGLPYSTASHLKQSAITAFHAADLGLSKSSDADILAYANEHRMIVVTLDADFHILLAASGAASPSVMRLRLQGKNGSQVAEIISAAVTVTSDSLEAGAVVSVSKTLVRVKLLPLTRRAGPSV